MRVAKNRATRRSPRYIGPSRQRWPIPTKVPRAASWFLSESRISPGNHIKPSGLFRPAPGDADSAVVHLPVIGRSGREVMKEAATEAASESLMQAGNVVCQMRLPPFWMHNAYVELGARGQRTPAITTP